MEGSSPKEHSSVYRAVSGASLLAPDMDSSPTPDPDRGRSGVGFSPAPGPPVTSARVSLVRPGRPAVDESARLLRDRLRAATLILFGAIGVFYLRTFLVSHAPVRQAHLVVVLGLGASLAVLWGPIRLSARRLRFAELLIFGAVTLYLGMYQYASVTQRLNEYEIHEAQRVPAWAAGGSSAPARESAFDTGLIGVPSALGNSILYMSVLMAVYGMLIPNTWKQATLMIGPMAISTVAVGALLYAQHEVLAGLTRTEFGWEQLSSDLLMLSIAAVMAIYGTHMIHSLRAEVHEARRMGQYVLRRKLGGGGMGEVYLAEHQLMKRPCALKLIRREHATEARVLARFEREVRAMARLSHWNSVEIYDFGQTEDGTFYYVMEYLRGPSLADLVRDHGPLPAGRVVYLMRQACNALAEAHGVGLVHRDLKPANIIAAHCGGQRDVVKLVDFGLVTAAIDEPPPNLEATIEGIVSGSPMYMSPEQAFGVRGLDGRSDLYSLGAVAYHLITGRPPFEGPTALGIMLAHTQEPPPPPSRFRPDVPADLEAVVLRCLAKRPAERFHDARELERALAACRCAREWDAQKAAAWWAAADLEKDATPDLDPAATVGKRGR